MAKSSPPSDLPKLDLPPIETVSIDDLKQDPKNARRHGPRNMQTIRRSIRETGMGRSVLVDENNQLIAGNGVHKGAKAEGITKVRIVDAQPDEVIAVRRKGLTEDQKKRMALFDNRAGELAEWDDIVLPDLLNEVGIEGLFTGEEFQKMLPDPEIEEMEIQAPPTMAWTLIGIPLKSFVKVQELLAKLQDIAKQEQGFSVQTTGKPR